MSRLLGVFGSACTYCSVAVFSVLALVTGAVLVWSLFW